MCRVMHEGKTNMSIVHCAIQAADNGARYYNRLANVSYVSGLIANLALNIFTLIAVERNRDLEDRVMVPIIAELMCLLMFFCSYNLECFKTQVLAFAKEPVEAVIVKVDDKIARLAEILVSDYQFQAKLYGSLRIISGLNGIYYLRPKEKILLFLSVMVVGVGLCGWLKKYDEFFVQKAWNGCK